MISVRNQDYDYMKPVWTGDTALNESFWPVSRDPADADTVISLLYRAEEISEVRTCRSGRSSRRAGTTASRTGGWSYRRARR